MVLSIFIQFPPDYIFRTLCIDITKGKEGTDWKWKGMRTMRGESKYAGNKGQLVLLKDSVTVAGLPYHLSTHHASSMTKVSFRLTLQLEAAKHHTEHLESIE